LDGARIHAGCVERSQLLLGRLRSLRGGCREPFHDVAQGGVVALDKLGKAAEARVLGRERGARQPAAVREAVEVLAGGAARVQVRRIEPWMHSLARERTGGGETGNGWHEQTASDGHAEPPGERVDASSYVRERRTVERGVRR